MLQFNVSECFDHSSTIEPKDEHAPKEEGFERSDRTISLASPCNQQQTLLMATECYRLVCWVQSSVLPTSIGRVLGKLDGPHVGSAWVGRAACIDRSESNMNSITPDVVSPKLTTCLVDTNSTTSANQTGEEYGEAIKEEGGAALKHTYLDGVYGRS